MWLVPYKFQVLNNLILKEVAVEWYEQLLLWYDFIVFHWQQTLAKLSSIYLRMQDTISLNICFYHFVL